MAWNSPLSLLWRNMLTIDKLTGRKFKPTLLTLDLGSFHNHVYMCILLLLFLLSHIQLFCNPMDCSPPDSSVHGISQQEYWRGCHFLLQGIFFTQGSNLHLPDWQVNSLPLSHQGSPPFFLFLWRTPTNTFTFPQKYLTFKSEIRTRWKPDLKQSQ